ncbi:MAG: hypothetical protein ACRD0Q_02085, partial [Acidimicrobiales bacterium]
MEGRRRLRTIIRPPFPLGFLLFAALLSLSVMNGLGRDLAKMHQPGAPSFRPGAVTSPALVVQPDRMAEALDTWKDWHDQPYPRERKWPTGTNILRLWLLVDSVVLAPCVFGLLLKLRRAAHSRLRGADESMRRATPLRRHLPILEQALELPYRLPIAYLGFDLIENMLAVSGTRLAGRSSIGPVAMALGVVSSLKWIALVWSAGSALTALLLLRQARRPLQATAPVTTVLLGQILTVAMFGVLFLRQDQVGDVIRTWGDHWYHAVFAYGAALVAGGAIAVTGRRMLTAPTADQGTTVPY